MRPESVRAPSTRRSASHLAMRMRRGACLVAVVALAAVTTGGAAFGDVAGTSGSSAAAQRDKNVARAVAQVKKFSKPTTKWTPPGESFDATSLADQKGTVWYVPILGVVPIFQAISSSLETALENTGLELQVCDGNGNPADWDKCINQAVDQDAAGIIVDGFSPDLVAAAVENATQNDVPVIIGNYGYPEKSTDEVAYTSLVTPKIARLVADWVIADSKGKANILLAETTDSSNTEELIHETMLPHFEKRCPDCEVSLIGSTTADWSTKLGPATATELLQNSDINYFVPEYDGMAPFMTAAAARDGRDDIKVSTFNANLQQMQDLADGDFIYAEVGANIDFLSWAYADQIMRMILDVAPAQNAQVPVRLFTRQNVKSLDITEDAANSGEWYGNVDYHAEFLKLWGLEG